MAIYLEDQEIQRVIRLDTTASTYSDAVSAYNAFVSDNPPAVYVNNVLTYDISFDQSEFEVSFYGAYGDAFYIFTIDELGGSWIRDTIGLARLHSPVLTGIPMAPTAASGVSTTQLATTAFVQGEISGKMEDDAPLFKTTLQNVTVSSTAKGSNFSDSFAISNPPSGYVCLGVIQWDWASGSRQNWFNNYGIWADKTTIYVKLCNMHATSAANGVLEVCLLWARADNTSHYSD